MASVFAKLGASGARMGGKMAAKQVGKKMGKQIAKKALKSAVKGVAKKGVKGGGKKAMKGAGKKTGKKLMKKTVKKGLKKMAKKASKASESESEQVSSKATPTVSPTGASDEKRKKKKAKSRSKERGTAKSTKSAGDSKKSQSKGSKSRRREETPASSLRSETTETTRSDSLAKKQKNRNGKSTKKERSKSKESKVKVPAQPKEGPKTIKRGLFGGRKKSVSETTEDTSAAVPLTKSVSHTEISESTESVELGTSRTTITNETTREESNETSSISAGQAAPNPMARRPTLTSREMRRSISAGPSRFVARQSISKPSTSRPSVANLSGPVLDNLKQKQYEQLLEKGKRVPGAETLKDAVHQDLLTKEAAKEVDDQEFNLMLFRLAKHLMMDSGSGKVEGSHKPRRKRRRKASEWLQALGLIIRAQNEGSAIREMCVQQRPPSCHAMCHPCPCSIRDNTKAVSMPVVAQEENGEKSNVREVVATQGGQSESGQVGTERVTKPSSSELLASNDSRTSSGSDLTSSVEQSSSSYSPKQFREDTERFCDVIRAVQNIPTPSPMQQCRRTSKPCTCRHKSKSPNQSPNTVVKSQTAAPPAATQALNIAFPASDPTTSGPPTAFQQTNRYCHGIEQLLPCAPTMNTFCLTDYHNTDPRPIAAVPYCINLCDPMAMALPTQLACQDQFVVTNVVDPNVVYMPDYYV